METQDLSSWTTMLVEMHKELTGVRKNIAELKAKWLKPTSLDPGEQGKNRISFRVDEIPYFTGVHKNAVAEAIKSGELPTSFHNHKRKMVRRDDLERWLFFDRGVPENEKIIKEEKKRRKRRNLGGLTPKQRTELEAARKKYASFLED